MQLFTVPKVGVHCDGIGHRLETRADHVEKIIELTLRVQPFTAQLAAALDPDWYGFVKRFLFKQGDGSAITDVKSIEFKPPSDRQLVTAFASTDTVKASIAFDQVKVTKIRARTEKGIDGWALIVHVSFGPVGRAELEYVNAWYTEQRFLSFEAADPSLFAGGDSDGNDDAEEEPPPADGPPAPMFDTDPTGRVLGAQAEPAPVRDGGRRKRTH
jgi:hypothetical protein